MEKPECKLIGENGNVFNLIGIVRKTLRRQHLYDQLETFDCELADLQKTGGSYEDVLVLVQKYVDPIWQ